jgi:hypothetical protein
MGPTHVRASCDPVKLTHKINHHKGRGVVGKVAQTMYTHVQMM